MIDDDDVPISRMHPKLRDRWLDSAWRDLIYVTHVRRTRTLIVAMIAAVLLAYWRWLS